LSKWPDWVRRSVVELEKSHPTFSTGTYPGHDPDENHAADFMVPGYQSPAGRALGQRLADLIASQAFCQPRGIWYVIFWGRIWSMTRPAKGWLPYFDRNSSNPSRSHHNHVHVSWYRVQPKNLHLPDGPAANQAAPYTPGWVPDAPWVFYLGKQEAGIKHSDSVWLIQKALALKPYDGTYTDALRERVKLWQREVAKDAPEFCDGILGQLQARTLLGPHVGIEARP
jgi:hypothetical protein